MLAELIARWRGAYAALSVAVEAPAAQALDERLQITTGHSEGSAPRGPNRTRAEYHRAKFDQWGAAEHPSVDLLRELVAKIELDLDRLRHRPPMRVDDRGLPETEDERNRRVLDHFAGVHYADAAVREGCSKNWLRTLRRRDGRCMVCGLGDGAHDPIAGCA